MLDISSPKLLSLRNETIFAWGIIGAACIFLVVFGVFGLFRSAFFGFDFVVFYQAGVELLKGENPWLMSVGTGAPFSYPPHIATLIAVYGLLPFQVALVLHTLVNIVSILVVTYLANHWFVGVKSLREITLIQGLCLALVIGNPFVAHSVYEGQLSLPAVALLLLSWFFLQNGRWLIAGILLGVASIKPQVAILYIAWLVFSLQLRMLTISALVVIALLIPAVMSFGVLDVFIAWFESISDYSKQWPNQPGSPHVVGLEGLFVSLGVQGLGSIFKATSVIFLWWVYLKRDSLPLILIVNLFFFLTLTFIYGHDTDFVILSLFFSYMVCVAAATQRKMTLLLACVFLLVMFFPQRFIRSYDLPILYHTRSIALGLCFYFVYVWKIQIDRHRSV